MRAAALLACALGASARKAFTEEEFRAIGRSPADARITFSAALPRRNLAELEQRLFAASDPDSPHYGAWMSQQEVYVNWC